MVNFGFPRARDENAATVLGPFELGRSFAKARPTLPISPTTHHVVRPRPVRKPVAPAPMVPESTYAATARKIALAAIRQANSTSRHVAPLSSATRCLARTTRQARDRPSSRWPRASCHPIYSLLAAGKLMKLSEAQLTEAVNLAINGHLALNQTRGADHVELEGTRQRGRGAQCSFCHGACTRGNDRPIADPRGRRRILQTSVRSVQHRYRDLWRQGATAQDQRRGWHIAYARRFTVRRYSGSGAPLATRLHKETQALVDSQMAVRIQLAEAGIGITRRRAAHGGTRTALQQGVRSRDLRAHRSRGQFDGHLFPFAKRRQRCFVGQ